MDRTINFADVKKAVDEAYESFKSESEGEVSPYVAKPAHKEFGISVALADGRTYDKADADSKFVLGSIVKVPVSTVLLSQNSKDELMKKAGECGCCCKEGSKANKPKDLPLCARGVRAVSAIEPTGDPESKWNLIENRMIDLIGNEAPEFDESVYRNLKAAASERKEADALAEAGFALYDDTAMSVDLYAKAVSMKVSTKMLARLGATIAADGVNPWTKKIVFDGAIAPTVVSMMATHGPHKMKGWLIATGVPAKSGFGGGILAIVPGVMAVAVYSPELNGKGVSIKATQAIKYIMNKLQINVFGSAKVKIDK